MFCFCALCFFLMLLLSFSMSVLLSWMNTPLRFSIGIDVTRRQNVWIFFRYCCWYYSISIPCLAPQFIFHVTPSYDLTILLLLLLFLCFACYSVLSILNMKYSERLQSIDLFDAVFFCIDFLPYGRIIVSLYICKSVTAHCSSFSAAILDLWIDLLLFPMTFLYK